jgi:hypothetical protein
VFFGLPESPITNVVFDNVKINANKGLVANFITGLVFQNCSSITIPNGAGNAVIPYAAESVSGSNIINGINTTTGVSTSCNLSVDDFDLAQKFSIYPNPVKGDDFTINSDSGIQKILIYNLSGAKMKEQNANDANQLTIDVKGFSAGCYFVQIILSNGRMSRSKFLRF